MKIKVIGIKDAGRLEDERVILIATEDVDLGDYMTCYVNEIGESTISTDIQSTFWFPDIMLKKRDHVVVYTRSGQRGRKVSDDGSTVYFYYRNSDNPLCVSDSIGAIILEVSMWNFESKRL